TAELPADCSGCDAASCCVDIDGVERCVDLVNSIYHCGACGVTCENAQACRDGVCGCAIGTDDCDNDPSNGCEAFVNANSANCGACGVQCSSEASCIDGVCVCNDGNRLECQGPGGETTCV